MSLMGYCSQSVINETLELCAHYDALFSRTLEGSDVWRINHAQGTPVECSPETIELVQCGIKYGELTCGLFDVSIGAVTALWDFLEGVKPDDAAIADAVGHVNYRLIQVDGNIVTLSDPQAMLDFGGIAKGFIADKLITFLREQGCKSALLNLGGHVCCLGYKPDGSKWRVGTSNPSVNDGKVYATFNVADSSVVSSGLYERCFEQDGVTYHHILNPRTGFPVETNVLNATIVSSSSVEADVYTTFSFLAGIDIARETLKGMEMNALLMDENQQWVCVGNPSVE